MGQASVKLAGMEHATKAVTRVVSKVATPAIIQIVRRRTKRLPRLKTPKTKPLRLKRRRRRPSLSLKQKQRLRQPRSRRKRRLHRHAVAARRARSPQLPQNLSRLPRLKAQIRMVLPITASTPHF
jgi:hypothetical protein